ncbi:phytanoyl-CoA dioxygenase family protein [Sphingomonas baiyangensis]|uniref:Phytanoyl-CoA dioxygenase family protein n=1 Tax=Sphingomonas baiyangensis TaxID=2572576 RepID=A0A4U1L5S2_9SPHN|nr:phytanoyl-CoA dioxygenase family protein [Sphingomonas baiyangensis]TKD52289.1 phytanoyl-CoA dioxygenase family protein [Sphingomonas baiyangensis]
MHDHNRVSFASTADHGCAVAAAVAHLRRDGVVVLDDLIDRNLLAECSEMVTARHPDMALPDRAQYFGPYVGRHTIPLQIDGALADPAVLLPKPVARIAATLLDDTFKIDSVGLLVAVPGAPDQTAHRDAWLYPRQGVDHLLPAFALAFAVPLVRMDEASGRTAFWRGSHRTPGATPATLHDLAPTLDPGSAIMWDYRIHHRGLANNRDVPRPVIFSALSREWWVEIDPPEAKHYRKLKISRSAFEAFGSRWQARLSRASIEN